MTSGERAYIEGKNTVYREQLAAAIAGLGTYYRDRTIATRMLERSEVIAVLRRVCEDFGDNNWSDNLHLVDIIEKHLIPYLIKRVDSSPVRDPK